MKNEKLSKILTEAYEAEVDYESFNKLINNIVPGLSIVRTDTHEVTVFDDIDDLELGEDAIISLNESVAGIDIDDINIRIIR